MPVSQLAAFYGKSVQTKIFAPSFSSFRVPDVKTHAKHFHAAGSVMELSSGPSCSSICVPSFLSQI